MKLSSYRDKDRMHIRGMDAAGLVTHAVKAALSEELRGRLRRIRETEWARDVEHDRAAEGPVRRGVPDVGGLEVGGGDDDGDLASGVRCREPPGELSRSIWAGYGEPPRCRTNEKRA